MRVGGLRGRWMPRTTGTSCLDLGRTVCSWSCLLFCGGERLQLLQQRLTGQRQLKMSPG